MTELRAVPLTSAAFAPFGQVIDTDAAAPMVINEGRAKRYHDLARVELGGVHPRAAVSIFDSAPVALPYALTFLERHPFGSQAFIPLAGRFLVIVAPDAGGEPGDPLAFVTAPGQGVNYGMNTWHGALAPLDREGRFIIVDREGEGNNLVIHRFAEAYTVVLA